MNVIVMGPARSGTTFLLKLIENSLPGKTEVYIEPKDPGFFREVRFQAADHHLVKILFEHWNSTPDARLRLMQAPGEFGFEKAAFLVRDLRDIAISRLLYYGFARKLFFGVSPRQERQWLDLLKEKEQHPQRISYLSLAEKLGEVFKIPYVEESVVPGFGVPPYLKVLGTLRGEKAPIFSYEALVRGDLASLNAGLGLDTRKPKGMGSFSYTRREGVAGGWKSFFTPEDRDWFHDRFGSLLEEWGYRDWSLAPVEHLSSESLSGYVEKRFQEAGRKTERAHHSSESSDSSMS